MRIRKHSRSHLVELDDGSRWQIFPGDLDATLNWQPDTDLKLVRIDDAVIRPLPTSTNFRTLYTIYALGCRLLP
jgi:hypothetical protein